MSLNFFSSILCLLISFQTFGKVQFSSDSISIQFPNVITASGNANFYTQEISINADQFFYNTDELTGSFDNNVLIQYENSTLSGNHVYLNLNNKEITGKGNILLKTSGFEATSDDLIIVNYKLAHLKNNVEIKRNGSQINSDGLVYNLENDTILSTDRVKLKFE